MAHSKHLSLYTLPGLPSNNKKTDSPNPYTYLNICSLPYILTTENRLKTPFTSSPNPSPVPCCRSSKKPVLRRGVVTSWARWSDVCVLVAPGHCASPHGEGAAQQRHHSTAALKQLYSWVLQLWNGSSHKYTTVLQFWNVNTHRYCSSET